MVVSDILFPSFYTYIHISPFTPSPLTPSLPHFLPSLVSIYLHTYHWQVQNLLMVLVEFFCYGFPFYHHISWLPLKFQTLKFMCPFLSCGLCGRNVHIWPSSSVLLPSFSLPPSLPPSLPFPLCPPPLCPSSQKEARQDSSLASWVAPLLTTQICRPSLPPSAMQRCPPQECQILTPLASSPPIREKGEWDVKSGTW